MIRSFRLRCVTRRRLVWLVTLVMLCQQVALAAYVCQAVPGTVGQVVAMTSSTAATAMGDDCAEMRGAPASPLCQQHCAPDQATQVSGRTASVPPCVLIAVPPMLMSVASVALRSDRALAQHELRRTPPLIPRLLFCSLLI